MTAKSPRSRVYGRVLHTGKKRTWLELTRTGLRIRGYHCHKFKLIPLQGLVDLAVGQLPLL